MLRDLNMPRLTGSFWLAPQTAMSMPSRLLGRAKTPTSTQPLVLAEARKQKACHSMLQPATSAGIFRNPVHLHAKTDARCLPSSRGLWPAGCAHLTRQSSCAPEPAQYKIAAFGPVQDERSLQPRILSHAYRLTVTMSHAKALALVCPNSPR